MTFQPVPDTAEAIFHFVGSAGGGLVGSEAQFTLYVRDTINAWTAAQLSLLDAYCADWWATGKDGGPALRTLFHPDWTLVDVTAHDLESASGLTTVQGVNTAGTRAGTSLPSSVAALVRESGTAGGGVPRGWMFWNAGVESDTDGNSWLTAFSDLCSDVMNDWRATLDDPGAGGFATWAHVIVSRNLGTQPDPDPPRIPIRRATAVTNTVASITTRPEVASQRDRRPSS